jgi:hypothetical protein
MSLGESSVLRALAWIAERLREEPAIRRADLLDQAARRFDLTPLDVEALYRKLTGGQPPATPGAGSAP